MKKHALAPLSRLCPIILAALLLILPRVGSAQTPTPAPEAVPVTIPDTMPPAANYRIQYNGLVDGYYLFQTRNAKSGTTLTGRVYDLRQTTLTLAMAEINVFQNARPSGIGFKATLVTGDDTDINHYDFEGASGGRGEAQFKNIQQLYGTYALGADGAGLDFGKLVTPFGYEPIEASGNNNYSHSIPFGLLPTYNVGVRLYTPGSALGIKGLVATFYLVNALYNTQSAGIRDDNGRPAYIGQLTYTDPKGKLTLISTLGLAKDKFDFAAFSATSTNSKETLTDNDFSYALSNNLSLGVNYVYAKFQPENGAKQTLNALALYYHQTLTPKTGFGLRFSGTKLKTEGANLQPKPYEITATYLIKPAPNFTTYLEYRHDGTNVADSFLGSGSHLTQRSQDTLTVAGVFQF